jgi:hypothetical protein
MNDNAKKVICELLKDAGMTIVWAISYPIMVALFLLFMPLIGGLTWVKILELLDVSLTFEAQVWTIVGHAAGVVILVVLLDYYDKYMDLVKEDKARLAARNNPAPKIELSLGDIHEYVRDTTAKRSKHSKPYLVYVSKSGFRDILCDDRLMAYPGHLTTCIQDVGVVKIRECEKLEHMEMRLEYRHRLLY